MNIFTGLILWASGLFIVKWYSAVWYSSSYIIHAYVHRMVYKMEMGLEGELQ